MQPWHYVVDSLLADLHPSILIWIVFGAFAGMATGLLPGLGAAAGMALLIPVTLTMDPVPALAMLTALYYGSMYGHTVTSIVLNAPADAAVASTFDGYPLTKQGRTGPALVIQAVVSGIGGTVGIILCSVIAIFAAKQTAHVGPAEVFLIVLVGLGCIVLMLGERRVYGLLCCIIGFAAGTVGTDVTTGAQRFTFGHVGLLGGIDFIPVVIGLFALAEIFYMLYQQHDDDSENAAETAKVKQGAFWPTRQDWRETRGATARSTLIGFGVGVLPGAGATAASLLAYSAEKAVSRTPEKFGKGAIEGLVAPEAAHTAAVAGAMVPMLTLGIPGSAATAVLLGAFLIFGLTPGPLFLTEHPDTAWGLISSMYIGNVVLVILSLAVIPFCVYLARIPLKTLAPLVILFCAIGTYAIDHSVVDLGVLLVAGVLGFFMKMFGYPPAALVIALVLGPLAETTLRQALVISDGSPSIFFTRGPSQVIILAVVLIVLAATAFRFYRARRAKSLDLARLESSSSAT
jgi:putative tricarboxylic transport membrane protein